jgi:hypothetical protein
MYFWIAESKPFGACPQANNHLSANKLQNITHMKTLKNLICAFFPTLPVRFAKRTFLRNSKLLKILACIALFPAW